MPEATVSSKGQIVLPKTIRKAFGIKKGDRVRLEIEENSVRITRVQARPIGDWRSWRGFLSDTDAIEDHLAEHADEAKK